MSTQVTDLVAFLFDRAQLLARDHMIEESIEVCRDILRRTQGDPEQEGRAHGFLGDMYLLIRDIPSAERHLSRAIQCSPGNGEYHYLLGCTFTVASRFKEAIRKFSEAQSIMPDNAEVLRGLGWATHCIGEAQEAEGFLRRSIGLDPENVSALNDLSVCLMAQHRYDEALGILDHALDVSPDDHLLSETRSALQQLKLDHNRNLMEEERTKRSLGSRGYARPVYAEVEELIDRWLRRSRVDKVVRESARRLWIDYLRKESPQVRRSQVWAAAVLVAVDKISGGEFGWTATFIAQQRGLTASSISSAHKRIWGMLALDQRADAYPLAVEAADGPPPLH